MASIAAADRSIDSSLIDNRAPSVGHLFRSRVAAEPGAEAYRYVGPSGWTSLTWTQAAQRAYAIAAGLVDLGVQPEDRVSLACSTRIEWALVDLGIMCAGAATTTIYPTTQASDVLFIIGNSGSRMVVAENDVQVAKLDRSELHDVLAVVTIDGTGDGDWVLSLADLEQRGREALEREPSLVDDRINAIKPQDLATVIYTSGTTGRPKGVRLAHDAWTYEAAAVASTGMLGTEDFQFLWLPLAHVFGKVLLTLPIQIGHATAIDGRIDKIVEHLGVLKPTYMGAAPRIFEKAYARVVGMIDEEGGIKAKLFHWATSVGRQVSSMREDGKTPSGILAVQHSIADKLVLHKVRERFGGRIRFFISGSAPLNKDVGRWFDSVGLVILEGYGLTETSAATAVNRPNSYMIGSVGWALPGTDVKVASDGELLVRGPGVMEGYHNNPEATAEVLDADGWLATGDIGEIDQYGFVRITERKKDLFKTSGGKYVAPSAIEAMFKGICPLVSQMAVYGAGKNFVSALITLDVDAVTGWAAHNGKAGQDYAQVVSSPEMHAVVQGYVDELNAQLNRWETIKQFVILDRDLTVDEGEITPSLKLRRKTVTEKYRAELDALYS